MELNPQPLTWEADTPIQQYICHTLTHNWFKHTDSNHEFLQEWNGMLSLQNENDGIALRTLLVSLCFG